MPNDHFAFKQFTVWQRSCSQKVSTDACIFGAWIAMHCASATSVLDIGAGTGLLMMMVAQKSEAEIHGVELDHDCFGQMQENIAASPWAGRLKGFEGDVKQLDLPENYGLILSNPPFYENQLASPDERKNLAWHSSSLTLEDLFGAVTRLLGTNGAFALIIPHGRKQELLSLAARTGLHISRSLSVRHTCNHPFTRYMAICSRSTGMIIEEVLDIKSVEGNYTQEMMDLLRDYYLFL